MKINVRQQGQQKAFEQVYGVTAEEQLERAVMSCLLWEDTFYESGVSIADRIAGLVQQVDPSKVFALAVKARTQGLRHAPLRIAVAMLQSEQHKKLVRQLLPLIIRRPDEMGELISLYWKDKKTALAAQLKRGLADVFTKFDEYQLAKYNRDAAIKLRDVLFLVHPKPEHSAQQAMWNRLVRNELKTPDTWEVRLSGGQNKREAFETLLAEGKLGGVALISNLRNMSQAKVDSRLVYEAIRNMKSDLVFPYRYMQAAKHAPEYKEALEAKMVDTLRGYSRLAGRTLFMVDVSASMRGTLSHKGEMSRMDAATSLAVMLREICEGVDVYTFSSNVVKVEGRGFELGDRIINSQPHRNTYLDMALRSVDLNQYDRAIIISDEEVQGEITIMHPRTYMLNVASYENGIEYGDLIRINGFSEHSARWIAQYEASRTSATVKVAKPLRVLEENLYDPVVSKPRVQKRRY